MNGRSNVLIVGDWFVDEYWFMARHYSEISSHTGPLHFRIVSDPKDAVKDLCGAGLIARVLYELRTYWFDSADSSRVEEQVSKALGCVKKAISQTTNVQEKQFPESLPKSVSHFLGQRASPYGEPISYKIDDIIKIALADPSFHACKPDVKNTIQELLFRLLQKDYELFGAGVWNSADGEILKHYIHARCVERGAAGAAVRAAFQQQPKTCDHAVDIKLCRIQAKDQSPNEIDQPTIRIIRAYRFGDSEFKLMNRIDWEPRPAVRGNHEPSKAAESCVEELEVEVQHFDTVIVDDHMKGVLDEGIVQALQNYKGIADNAKWYVRTKNKQILPNPSIPKSCAELKWFAALKKIEVLAIGPDIASRYYPMERLLLTSGHLTRRSFELFEQLSNPRITAIVVASDKMELSVLVDGHLYAALGPSGIRNIDLEKINWTTAFFAALVHEMLTKKVEQKNNWKDAITAAINNAHEHSGVKIPSSVYFRSEACSAAGSTGSEKTARSVPALRVDEWTDVKQNWIASTSGMGIIECKNGQEDNKVLQVWRASTDLPGYIACIGAKREAVGRIWQAMRAFTMQSGVERPLSILLEADPGSGKTFLAERLAEAIQGHLIQHDVTQMIHRDELLDLFDKIATAQAEGDDPVVVFVDEINATLDASPVYGAFLSPLEAGYYMRRGTKFRLKPCIWIFAGTQSSDDQQRKRGRKKVRTRRDKAEKFGDFISRLTIREEIGYAQMQVHAANNKQCDLQKLRSIIITLRCTDFNKENRRVPRPLADTRGPRDEYLKEVQSFLDIENQKPGATDDQKKPSEFFECVCNAVQKVCHGGAASEISLTPFSEDDLILLWELDAEARLEQVYFGAQMLHRYFGDVTEVSLDVMEVMYSLDPANSPARKIRNLVLSLRNVQYGRVDNANCTSTAWRNVLSELEPMLCKMTGSVDFAEGWTNKQLQRKDYVKIDFG